MTSEDSNTRPWIAFFSQTGKEIADLSESLGRWPDAIFSNKKPEQIDYIDRRIQNCILTPRKPTSEYYDSILQAFDKPIITLHGWLRIIPEDICNKYEMYNNHPGLIAMFPELEGKDPQIRAHLGNYPYIGCTLHKVSPEVDRGKIIFNHGIENKDFDLEQIFLKLREISLEQWLKLLTKLLYEKHNCPSRLVKYWEEYSV